MTKAISRFVSLLLVLLVFVSCAHYKTTLTNDQGRTMTCEASGKNGIVTGHYVRSAFQQCIADANAQGFHQGASAPQTAAPASTSPSSPSSDAQLNVEHLSSADFQAKLLTLKQAYQQGLITQQEYEEKKKTLIDHF